MTYESQCQGDIEKQRTYEFYLPKNFGYTWAVLAYHSLPGHYLKITPAIEEMRLKAVIDGQLRFIRRMISGEKVILNTHLQVLRAIQSEKKQQAYIDRLCQDNPDWKTTQEKITPLNFEDFAQRRIAALEKEAERLAAA